MPVVAPLLIGALVGGGIAAITSAQSAKATKAANANQASTTPTATQTVGDTSNKTNTSNNLGRAALISTSPSGVLSTDPTGRRKLLGND